MAQIEQQVPADELDGLDGPLPRALARLDAALARLERAAVITNPAETQLAKLRLDHGALRTSVGEALQQLDVVLAQLQAEKAEGRAGGTGA